MFDIQPTILPLAKLLDRRLFQIPEYQRAYSWGSRQRRDLFDDIEKMYLKETQEGHFMATIVCLRRKMIKLGTDEYDQLDIVDGQQRLTTIILLLKAIKLSLEENYREESQRQIQEISELLVKVEGDNLLLQTNLDLSHHFSDFIRDGKLESANKGKTLADRELLTAISDCREFVSEWLKKKRGLLELYACIKNRLFFILHEINDEKLVYTVFEVLNSRGMEVSWLDRLKSILMGRAFELQNKNRDQLISDLHNIWRDIYTQIGLHQGMSTEALRFAATLFASNRPQRPLSESDAVDEFLSKAHDAASIRRVAKWLLEVTRAYDKVISNRRQNSVTRISQARLLAVAIHLQDSLDESEKNRLLALWEKVTFRIYGMMGNDARTGVGNYVRLAWRISNENLSMREMRSGIRYIGKKFPIEEAVKSLRNADCCNGWAHELRYFMFRYEEHLTREAGNNFQNEQWERIWEANPSKSIEHIFPKNKASDDVKHVLGNLMMLPPKLNSKLQDKEPRQKFEAYRQTGLLSAVEVASTSRWSKKAVREREKNLLRWATDEWGD